MSQTSSTSYVPMVKEVAINNFKGIKHCEIKDLAKVNLFIGKNSCGKSAIMEAMYFTGKEFLGANLPQCLQRRANRGNWSVRELWYAYAMMSSEVQVRMKFVEDDLVGLRMQYIEQEKVLRDFLFSGSGQTGREDMGYDYRSASFSHCAAGNPKLHTNHDTEIRRFFNHSVFIEPAVKTEVREIEGNYLSLLKLSEADSSDLAKRTAEIYDTKPSWEFLPHPDFPPDNPSRFAILEGDRRLFLDNFGDGLRYGLAIIAVAKTRTNTALFVEEIESHQHPEAIRNLVSNLLDIARTNNIQLFITTHNDYARNYLYYYYKTPEERKKEFRCFHVVRNKDTGEVEAKIEEGIINITEDLHGRPQ